MGLVKNIIYHLSNKRLIKLLDNQTIFPYYHIVNNKEVHHIKNLYKYKNVDEFKRDLEVLLKNYKPINPEIIIKNSNKNFIIPKNSFLLSFDDGLKEVYDIIFPVLKERNIKAIFFINPKFIDNNEILYRHHLSVVVEALKEIKDAKKLNEISNLLGVAYSSHKQLSELVFKIDSSNKKLLDTVKAKLRVNIDFYLKENEPYLSKSNIQEMIYEGYYFGGHTMSHPRLNNLSPKEQEKEVINSIEWLKNTFKINYSLFAFPFSDRSISKGLIKKIFEYDEKILIFGNSGLKKDIDNRIIQRFSLENPAKNSTKQIITENLYKLYNKAIFKYRIKRK